MVSITPTKRAYSVSAWHWFSICFSFNDSYNNLNNVVINRGKLLQTAVHSLQLFDRSMDQVCVLCSLSFEINHDWYFANLEMIFLISVLQFLGWLSEAESLCENAEQEIERNPLILKVSYFFGNYSCFLVSPFFRDKNIERFLFSRIRFKFSLNFPKAMLMTFSPLSVENARILLIHLFIRWFYNELSTEVVHFSSGLARTIYFKSKNIIWNEIFAFQLIRHSRTLEK